MLHRPFLSIVFIAQALYGVLGQSPPSHLPPMEPGVFKAHGEVLIDAPIQHVWDILLDFPSYPDWNPFVRSQVVADANFVPLADQTPHENLRLIIDVQIPPLHGPVDASTPGNPLNAQRSLENITHLDNEHYAAAWGGIEFPDEFLKAERWSVLSTFNGKTFYESEEVYYGLGAVIVKELFEEGLNEGFQAQAEALKNRAEIAV
ncbi:hypothetical protein C8J57DRAFT_1271527 [Mycena rebaudengoi]|nr:hypothetical protein C8J57DRAFT_1271527 [Mycena rebaudengoi]